MNLNNINIMGNLTRDPETKAMSSGKNLCRFSIANNRIYTKNGEKITEVSYFDVDVWGVIADNCMRYLKKGSGVIIEGRLRQDRWEKDGKTQSRVTIVANNVHFMPRKADGTGSVQRNVESDAVGQEVSDVATPQEIAWEE